MRRFVSAHIALVNSLFIDNGWGGPLQVLLPLFEVYDFSFSSKIYYLVAVD